MIEDRDLAEFCHTIFRGVTVGVGSLVLLFGSRAQVLIQCAFECVDGNSIRLGHSEDVKSSSILFDCLNHVVEGANLDHDDVLTLNFDDGKRLRIVPERNGLESYVITTRYGICPVAVS